MSRKPWIVFAVFAALVLVGCPAPEDTTGKSGSGSNIPKGQARISGKIALPEGTDAADLAGAKVYVVGQEAYAVTTDKDGKYQLSVNLDTPAARTLGRSVDRGLIGDLKDKAYSLLTQTKDKLKGLKLDDIDLSSVTDKILPPIAVKNAGTISGKVTLENKTEYFDTMVSIPGTSFSATTDINGEFTISNVPPGTYGYLRAKADGYGGYLWTEVRVDEDDDTKVPTKELKVATGTGGGLVINGGAAYTRSKTVNLEIDTGDYFLMKISEDPDFVGVRPTVAQPTATYTFKSDSPATGPSKLYIEFTTQDGFTYIISGEIAVISELKTNLTAPADKVTLDTGSPEFEWEASLLPEAKYEFQVAHDANFATLDYKNDTLVGSVFSPPLVLKDNTRYFWRVRTSDSGGASGPWSTVRTFTVPPHTVSITLSTDLPPNDPQVNLGSQVKITYLSDTLISVNNFTAPPESKKIYDSFKWYLDGVKLANVASSLRIGALLKRGFSYNLTVVGYIGAAPAGSTVIELLVQ